MTNARDKANNPQLNFTSKGIDDNADAVAITIDSSENVGIGTTSPSTKLTVSSGASSASVHSYSKLEIESSDHSALQFSGSTNAEQWLWFADDSTSTPVGGITYYHGGAYMGFRVEGSERVRIASSGNVGIGESNPDASLHITSNTPIIAFDETDASQEYRIGSFGGAFSIHDVTNSAFRFVMNNSGSIGIGETTPLGKLHVKSGDSGQGTANVHADELVVEGSANSGINILSATNGYGSLYFGDSGDSNAGEVTYNHASNYMAFATSGTERFRISSNGLAIGGTGASNSLDDYEEGTWTPSGPSLGVATIHKAVYTKIGNVVTVYCDITYNSSPADTAQATSLSGLPFSSSDDYYQQNTRVYPRNQNISAQVGGSTVNFRDVADGVIMTRSEFAGNRAQHTFIYTTA